MEQPLPQCWSTNSVLRAFFPRVAIGCRLSLKIDRNLSPSLAGEVGLSVATWYTTAWIGGTTSGEYLYRSVVQTTTETVVHVFWLTDRPAAWRFAYLRIRNTLTYLLVSARCIECLIYNFITKYFNYRFGQSLCPVFRFVSNFRTSPRSRSRKYHWWTVNYGFYSF